MFPLLIILFNIHTLPKKIGGIHCVVVCNTSLNILRIA